MFTTLQMNTDEQETICGL